MTDKTKKMTNYNWLTDYEAKRDALIAANAYDPAHERANCGVGLVASVDGTARRDVVEKSIQALKNVWHRAELCRQRMRQVQHRNLSLIHI